jgi:rRNA maturation RNase YbeY
MNICEVGSEQVPARAGAEVGKEGIGRLWASPRLKARLHVSSANAIKDPTSNLSPLTSQMEVLLGDIVISVPRALNQAAAYGNSFQQEMVFLAVHGMLHLLGYDDETDPGAARMMEIARQVMDKLGLGAVRDV